jgi:hypothetical protein
MALLEECWYGICVSWIKTVVVNVFADDEENLIASRSTSAVKHMINQ